MLLPIHEAVRSIGEWTLLVLWKFLETYIIAQLNHNTSAADYLSMQCTKVWIKSYGSALVKVRWNFSDQALWIGAGLTKL
jgi:hypothetical protein